MRTLQNALSSGKLAHAWLLSGIRGVGKTTTARILAKALNCLGKDGTLSQPAIEPCGVCANCAMIAEGRHMDILEMDAASRTGVGDIREIIDTVQYLPASARYKVYIIDEVHMLSTNAFNALLKTLEEPPPHVKFIFATTETRKVPITILSRCQRFDLRRVETEEIAAHLTRVLEKEHIQADPAALHVIAEVAEGSVRDSLSLLDQAIAHAEGPITAEGVRAMLGLIDRSKSYALLEELSRGKITEAMAELRAFYQAGADPVLLIQDLLSNVHLATRVKLAPETAEDPSWSESERAGAKKLAELPVPVLARFWQMLLKGLEETKLSPYPLAAVEMILVRIAYAADLPPPGELIRDSMAPAPAAKPTSLSPSKPEPSRPVVDAGNFQQLVALFTQKREALLHHTLTHDVELVEVKPGKLELHALHPTPKDFPGKVGALLTEWTGERWMVVLTEQRGAPTLAAQASAAEAAQKEAASKEAQVSDILTAFPGAEITKIKEQIG